MNHPDPDMLRPLDLAPSIVFLKPLAESRPRVEVGAFTYYDDAENAEAFFERNVLYHFDFVGDWLRIGHFCALATGVRFIMNGANHAMGGFSTFPFNIFGHGWENGFDPQTWADGFRGDTIVGSDVWLGRDVTVMPGVTIGPGAIVATGSVVVEDVRPYAIVGGNPAREVKRRFDDDMVDALMELAWWDWPLDKITRNLDAIRGADLAALRAAD